LCWLSKAAQGKELALSYLWQPGHWAEIGETVLYSALAGLFLGIYLLTWIGGLFIIAIVLLFFAVQFIIEHLQRKSSEYLNVVGPVIFLVLLIFIILTMIVPGTLDVNRRSCF